MPEVTVTRTAAAGILAGSLYLAGQAGELAFGSTTDERRSGARGSCRSSLSAGWFVALAVTVDPIHDIGLFVLKAAWIALGVAPLRATA